MNRQLAVEKAAAMLLERSLLPPSLPHWPGIELAARYASADDRRVGGDWYDAFALPSGEIWVVVGDVAGHGLNAAVVMGRIRSALRAYALLDVAPETVLDLVDAKVQHFEMQTFATVVCAVTKPPYDEVSIAVAGHPRRSWRFRAAGRRSSTSMCRRPWARATAYAVPRRSSRSRPTRSW